MPPDPLPRRRLMRHGAISLLAAGLPAAISATPARETPAQARGAARAASPVDERIRFALIGDTPYNRAEEAGLAQVLADARDGHAFYIHVGDIKSGSEFCTDALIGRRIGLLDSSPRPLVFVPGDNEWTDCSRFYLGNYDPLERLQLLRNLAYSRGGTLGRGSLRIESQAPLDRPPVDPARLPEHLRWRAGPCLFVTLNVPGSANGLTAALSDDAIRNRVTACIDWVHSNVRHAAQAGIRCLVLVCHAQVLPPYYQRDDGRIDVLDRSRPYAWLRHLMRTTVARFDGTVVWMYGDGHGFRHEKPWHRDGGQQGALDGFGPAPDIVASRLDRFVAIRAFGAPLSTAWVSMEIRRRGRAIEVEPVPVIG